MILLSFLLSQQMHRSIVWLHTLTPTHVDIGCMATNYCMMIGIVPSYLGSWYVHNVVCVDGASHIQQQIAET